MGQNFVQRISFYAKLEVTVPNSAGNALLYLKCRHVTVKFFATRECVPQSGEEFTGSFTDFGDRVNESLIIARLMPFNRRCDRRDDVSRAAMSREKNLNAGACGLRRLNEDEFMFVGQNHGTGLKKIDKTQSEKNCRATASVAVNADINWKAGSLAGGAPVLQCFFAIRNHVRQHSRNRAVTVNLDRAPMISLQKRFLFVHIPKTAGNSIQSILRDYSEDELVALRDEQDGIERFGLRNPKYKIKKHSTLAEYKTALGEVQFGGLYKFTCARNPWDRMVSLYFTPTQSPGAGDRKQFRNVISDDLSVSEYLQLEKREKDPFGNVDYIMRFEDLTNDFCTVCGMLGISPATLPRYNRSSREDYSKYYDDELRELVRTRFAAEIERFAYTFEER